MTFWNKNKDANLHVDIDLHIIPPQDFYEKLKECFCTRNDSTPTIESQASPTRHTRNRKAPTRRLDSDDIDLDDIDLDDIDLVVFKYSTSKNVGIYFKSTTGRCLLDNGWKYFSIQETSSGGAIV